MTLEANGTEAKLPRRDGLANLINQRQILFISILIVIDYLLSGHQTLLAWFGFFVAAYSTIANDSIQTLGTFLSSHRKTAWWLLWLVFGVLFIVVIFYGWHTHGHHLGYNRLERIPVPARISFFDVLAPIVLLVLTQLRIPVSTTFLILSIFSSDILINQMLVKSCLGYMLAFIFALMLWGGARVLMRRNTQTAYNPIPWQIAQWLVTGVLWTYWLMHDTANMVVFLPREVSFYQLLIILVTFFCLFGLIMYQRGTGIQEIVNQKQNSDDIRAATIIDSAFALVLIIFKYFNNIPMSTTWVFLGVLAGRELVIRSDRLAVKIIISDIGRASLGIVVSLFLVSLTRSF